MRKIQTSKKNHLAKNVVIIAEGTNTVLPNEDKSYKIIRTNHKSTKTE